MEPKWEGVFYRSGNKMMAVEVSTQPTFSAGKPHMLFAGQYVTPGNNSAPDYDVSPDGQRFLMLKEAEGSSGGGDTNYRGAELGE